MFRPVFVRDEISHHVIAERVVLGGQHKVQEKQLTDHVHDVKDLGDDEQHCQTAATPAPDDTCFVTNGYFLKYASRKQCTFSA